MQIVCSQKNTAINMLKSLVKFLSSVARADRSMIKYRMSLVSNTLQYNEHGDPKKVVTQKKEKLKKVCAGEVLVQMLAAPINPVDINVIQGVYPLKPKLPAIPGNEGVGKVLQLGPDVKRFKRGDTVILKAACLGTWRTHAIFKEDQLAKIPSKMGLAEAATLTINPCSAYRMLRDFKKITGKHCIIQNGANSACGQMVIQLCKIWGIPNIGIVRNRPKINELKNYLKCLGASWILTEEELPKTKIFREETFPKPVLALNCVGGKNGLNMVRHLASGATMVTYGGMSRQPVTAPTSAFIFKNIDIKGFWVTQWNKLNYKSPERDSMFKDLIDYIVQGKLKAPIYEMVPLKNYGKILKMTTSVKGFTGKKFIFDMTQ